MNATDKLLVTYPAAFTQYRHCCALYDCNRISKCAILIPYSDYFSQNYRHFNQEGFHFRQECNYFRQDYSCSSQECCYFSQNQYDFRLKYDYYNPERPYYNRHPRILNHKNAILISYKACFCLNYPLSYREWSYFRQKNSYSRQECNRFSQEYDSFSQEQAYSRLKNYYFSYYSRILIQDCRILNQKNRILNGVKAAFTNINQLIINIIIQYQSNKEIYRKLCRDYFKVLSITGKYYNRHLLVQPLSYSEISKPHRLERSPIYWAYNMFYFINF